jgi:hypothetical protein
MILCTEKDAQWNCLGKSHENNHEHLVKILKESEYTGVVDFE